MRRQSSFLIIAASVLCAAGVATAQSVLMGGSPGLYVSGSTSTVATSTASQTPSSTTGADATTTTPTPTTTAATDATITTPTPTTTTSPTPTTTTTPPATTVPGATTTGEAAIDQIVSITRVIEAGAPAASAFTVPAGQRLVVTDVLITNPGATAACGASIAPGGAVAAAPSGEAGTGLLCVPAQSSLNLGLTTGLEFEAGQGVLLANAAETPLHYHLRGFLVATGV